MQFQYPIPHRDENVVETHHGNIVLDPYRWMEDPDFEGIKKFVGEQNSITTPFLKCYVDKDKVHARLKELWDYPKYSCPSKRGQRYFYYHNSGLQNQSVLYVQETLDGEARVFLDPNLLSPNGTTSIKSTAFSEDGSLFAYALSEKGSDWSTIRFKEVATGKDLDDVLEKVKFSCISWTHDGLGIFYNRYNVETGSKELTDVNLNQKLYYHFVGEDQSMDILCAEFPDEPKWLSSAEISDCGNYLILTIDYKCEHVNRLYYCDLTKLDQGIKGTKSLPFVKLIDNFDAQYQYITNNGTVFTFRTNLDSPRSKVINIDLLQPDQEMWQDLIPQHEHDVLEWASCINNDKLIICYLHDVKHIMHLCNLNNGSFLQEIPLELGTVIGFSGKREHDVFFFKFTSFLTPGIVYQCSLANGAVQLKVFRKIVLPGLDDAALETKQVFYHSKDGTKIPMFIMHRKDLKMDGSNPTMLYGYGGFMFAITPWFSLSRIIFTLHYNGVAAVANIRGGGEYGESWHKEATKEKKQNSFDDFQYAARYLQENRYTSAQKLIIEGGSNGGLLVAACANQAPELFGCVIGHVGVMDMLRFHKFTIGHAWTSDYGDPDEEESFKAIIEYSPLHTIERVATSGAEYPSTLLLTADHDDRVVPSHSLKFIAQLQHTMGKLPHQKKPLLIRIDTDSGHGSGKSTAQLIEEVADVFNFMALTCDLTWTE